MRLATTCVIWFCFVISLCATFPPPPGRELLALFEIATLSLLAADSVAGCIAAAAASRVAKRAAERRRA